MGAQENDGTLVVEFVLSTWVDDQCLAQNNVVLEALITSYHFYDTIVLI